MRIKCKQCKLDFDERDPEWIRWCDIDGFCSDDCYDKHEKILSWGEEEYYRIAKDEDLEEI